jgi:NDP-sugar pyrophosphorylase family protein
MKYKLCLLAAGTGSRMAKYKFHKAFLPINNKPIISYIIEKFPKEIEIIVAVGHLKDDLKFFLKKVYPERKIKFINIKNYNSEGSGPGLSLLKCEKYLKCPFIFTSIDTLIKNKIPPPNKNWIMISLVKNPLEYLIYDKKNKKFFNKESKINLVKKIGQTYRFNAFVGIAGIKNFKEFWKGLKNNKNKKFREKEVADGLESINKKLKCINSKWFDTGNLSGYTKAQKKLDKNKNITKQNEQIYFVKNLVIKYFEDKNKIKNLINKHSFYKHISPKIISYNKNYLIYKFLNAKKLSDIKSSKIFHNFLLFMEKNFWSFKMENFKYNLYKFYKEKTESRVKLLFKKNKLLKKNFYVNDEYINNAISLIKDINWKLILANKQICKIHGDPQPENILVKQKEFKVIDFRDTFGESLLYCDIYYDFSKIHHALIISNKMVRDEKFSIKIKDNKVSLRFKKYTHLINNEKTLKKFCEKKNYYFKKVELLSIIIYLNIAPLYAGKYSIFLYYYALQELIKFKRKYSE